MLEVVARFELEHPNALPGDAVSLMQRVYRNPDLPLDLRLDAVSKAACFERPALSAAMVKDVWTPTPDPTKANQRIAELLQRGLGRDVALIDG